MMFLHSTLQLILMFGLVKSFNLRSKRGWTAFGSYGSIFYGNGASGWSFYTMGIDGNWKTWNGI